VSYGKDPNALAVATLYAACLKGGEKVSQLQIAKGRRYKYCDGEKDSKMLGISSPHNFSLTNSDRAHEIGFKQSAKKVKNYRATVVYKLDDKYHK